MSEYIKDVVNQTSKLDWAFPFQRTEAFPLDRSSVFSSLNDAIAYAKGDGSDSRELGKTSYVGQIISIYEEKDNSVSMYIIDSERSLKSVGAAQVGDNTSIEIIDNKIQIKDFGLGYYSYKPAEKNDDGDILVEASYVYVEGFKEGLEPKVISKDGTLSIAWFEPNSDSVEEIVSNLETLSEKIELLETNINAENGINQKIEDLKISIGQEKTDVNEATGLYKLIDQKANKEDIDKLIADMPHLKRRKVDSVGAINVIADDAEQYIYMVPTGLQEDDDKYDEYMVIEGSLERVGSWEVDLKDYAKTVDVNKALDLKVDKVENSRLMTKAEGDKLLTIEEGAEKNFISNISSEFSITDGTLSVAKISQENIDGLTSSLSDISLALDKKVNSQENARLITNDELNKLNNIKDLIQSVDTEKFTINDDGKLLLKSVDIAQISGITEALSNKVDKIAGSRLITTEEAKKLESLSIDTDGTVGISGTVSASNVQELYSVVTNIVTGSGSSLYDGEDKPLLNIKPNAEPNFINGVSSEFIVNENKVLSINNISSDKVTGFAELETEVQNINTLLNGYTTEDNIEIKGVVNTLEELTSKVNDFDLNYVSISDFNSVVGNLETMKNNHINILKDIEDLQKQLTWETI